MKKNEPYARSEKHEGTVGIVTWYFSDFYGRLRSRRSISSFELPLSVPHTPHWPLDSAVLLPGPLSWRCLNENQSLPSVLLFKILFNRLRLKSINTGILNRYCDNFPLKQLTLCSFKKYSLSPSKLILKRALKSIFLVFQSELVKEWSQSA